MDTRSAVCPVLVGREDEVAALSAAADQRRLTLIAGQAGTGKSCLASEALRLADSSGLGRLSGQCRVEGSVPYAPFVTAIRRRIRSLDDGAVAELFDGAAYLSAALLPEIVNIVGTPPAPPARADLAASVWRLLRRLAGTAGSVLLLEDLHWADQDTLYLFSYLASELADLPMWLVATYRSDELHRRHPLSPVLLDLQRGQRPLEINLEGISREHVRTMVSAILDGTAVGDEFVDALLERTGGNPFFVEELIKALLERGDIYRVSGDWARRDLADIEMPPTIRETLLARARTLEPLAEEILQLAALAGEAIDMPVLACAAAVNTTDVESVVLDGLRLQFLAERREITGTVYTFRHALTREAFADELIGPDRQHAHRQLAEAIVKVHHDELDTVAAQLADHYAKIGDAVRAAEYAVRAARQAAATSALAEAARRYDDGLRLLPRSDPQRLALLLEAAGILVEAPDRRLGVAFANEARDLARVRSDPVAEARAISALARDAWASGDTTRNRELVTEALSLVHGQDDFEEAFIIARLARSLTLTNRHEEARQRLTVGIELAEAAENFSALSLLHGTRMQLAELGPDFDDAYQAAKSAATLAEDGDVEWNLETNAGYINLWCGNFRRAEERLVRGIELGERFVPHDRYAAAAFAWLLSLRGDYEDAARRAEAISSSGSIPSRIVAMTARYEVAERRGEIDAGAILDEFWSLATRTGEAQRSVPALAARARHTALAEGTDAGLPVFYEALSETTTERTTGSHWLFSPDLARALAEEERLGDLERWVAAVSPLTKNDANDHNRAAGGLCDAYLASVRDDDAAIGKFESALSLYGNMPCPAREVEALIGLASLNLRMDQTEASAAAAERASQIARAIGANGLAAHAEEAIDRAAVPSVLVTVLFTDIVSSTERASELGDRRWRELLDAHDFAVRRQLRRYGGREVKTTGDGILVVFDAPGRAIRCACAVRDAVRALGVEVRAGLHTGEIGVRGEDVAGVAVHIAARVLAAARPGEVLVSGAVPPLVAGSGFEFDDRGEHELRGVPGRWRLLAVRG